MLFFLKIFLDFLQKPLDITTIKAYNINVLKRGYKIQSTKK
nr:MAG TPA: hypothetical protein [Caudoviricetes sp.]DAI99204.1 MAG TPA: hypothetical protein [Caudoviricetes sp.]DAQ47694.1 MAG TPA: hypothetical protein [Caudoviricetes sp.]